MAAGIFGGSAKTVPRRLFAFELRGREYAAAARISPDDPGVEVRAASRPGCSICLGDRIRTAKCPKKIIRSNRSSNANGLCWRTLVQPTGVVTTSQVHSSYLARSDISEFESCRPSHAVGLCAVNKKPRISRTRRRNPSASGEAQTKRRDTDGEIKPDLTAHRDRL